MNNFYQSFLVLLGRVLLSALFIWAVIAKVMNLQGTMSYMYSKQMPYIMFFLPAAILLQIVGAFFLLSGYRARLGAWLLILFIIPAAGIFHDFWNLRGTERLTEQILFMKDMAILGGLLLITAFGPGKYAFDKG